MQPGVSHTHYSVVVIGGGQAGLSMSYCLKERGIDHLVVEKHRVAEEWRSRRWNSFCLVTPNWQCTLPGYPYQGGEPDGFMVRDQIVHYIESYARSFDSPLLENTMVSMLKRDGNVFSVATPHGDYTADAVVVATGGYHVGNIPRVAERFPPEIAQIHSSDYKDAASLPPGDVLVVGTGQSGCQIAEDLHLAGRRVHLCVGGAPRVARRYRGRDVVAWLDDMGYYDKPVHEHPSKDAVRAKANHYVTGRDGGRDIDLRRFALEGMQLYGRLRDVRGTMLSFSPDLAANLDQADATAERIKDAIDQHIDARSLDAPTEGRYVPLWKPPKERADLDYFVAGIRSVIWSTGYRSDYAWIDLPIFNGRGYPSHTRGVTAMKGVYFLGLPWQYTWGSGRFSGVAADAMFLAESIQGTT